MQDKNLARADGVTVIICCYNSRDRLYQTLLHLAQQSVPDFFPWEIIVVNNASTDDTANFARHTWQGFGATHIDFRVIDEMQAGQMFARKTGAREAKYASLVFCDDDNWLQKDYVVLAKKMLDKDNRIGAGGGQNAPVTDAPAYPDWFGAYRDNYALGIPAEKSGDISYRGFVLGAGLVTRRALFLGVFDEKYPTLLNGRNGFQLSTGDDFEYCKRILLWGYTLYYDADLRLDHFIPKERLTLSYRDRLMKGIADAGKVLVDYDNALLVQRATRNKNKFRLLLMAPFRILFSRIGLSSRKPEEEKLKLFYLNPFQAKADTNKAIIKKFIAGR